MLASALALTAAVSGCGERAGRLPGPRAPAALHVVRIHKLAFDPAVLRAAPGDTVEWRNEDLVPHTVTGRDGTWGSGNLPPDAAWRWVVSDRDSAAYFCSYHTAMHGVVLATRR